MGKKTKINYIVDVMILIMFALSAVSGFALMRPEEERMMTTTAVMDENRAIISDIHIFSSFLMVAGVIAHLILHWKWMVTMTRNMTQNRESKQYIMNST